jgi:hypothetical protein
MAISNIASGEAGMSGDAMGKSGWACGLGGMRKGLTGDMGENGDGVSGSQYDSAGTVGVLSIGATGQVDVDVVSAREKLARRGVSGRGARQEGGKMVSETEAGRTRIVEGGVR